MNIYSKCLVYIIGCGAFIVGSTSHAATIFTESWDDPSIIGGATSTNLPAGWLRFSTGVGGTSQIWHPESTDRFKEADPLASPADGDQVLFLTELNTNVFRMTGAIIQPNTTYTLSAAIGNDLLSTNNQYWSLQLWTDADMDRTFTWNQVGDAFIGQEFGTTATAVNALPGDWALNTFSFDSSTVPNLVGQELIVFLNNWSGGAASFYDNVSLSASANPVPLPPTVILFLSGLGALVAGKGVGKGAGSINVPTTAHPVLLHRLTVAQGSCAAWPAFAVRVAAQSSPRSHDRSGHYRWAGLG